MLLFDLENTELKIKMAGYQFTRLLNFDSLKSGQSNSQDLITLLNSQLNTDIAPYEDINTCFDFLTSNIKKLDDNKNYFLTKLPKRSSIKYSKLQDQFEQKAVLNYFDYFYTHLIFIREFISNNLKEHRYFQNVRLREQCQKTKDSNLITLFLLNEILELNDKLNEEKLHKMITLLNKKFRERFGIEYLSCDHTTKRIYLSTANSSYEQLIKDGLKPHTNTIALTTEAYNIMQASPNVITQHNLKKSERILPEVRTYTGAVFALYDIDKI